MDKPKEHPAWTVEELRVELDRYEAELIADSTPRSTITANVYPVHTFLNRLDNPYRPVRASAGPIRASEWGQTRADAGPTARYGAIMTRPQPSPELVRARGRRSSYDGLRMYLSERPERVVRLSFSEIERIIGRELPPSAKKHRAWWANEQSGPHVHARSWMNAIPPRRTERVDFEAKTVDFVIPEEAG
jgi:hypothetical protein